MKESDQQKLKRVIVANSVAASFEEAKSEWYCYDRQLGPRTRCVCNKPIVERCYIRNRMTEVRLVVGNECVKTVTGENANRFFSSIKSVIRDHSLGLGKDTAWTLVDMGVLTERLAREVERAYRLKHLTKEMALARCAVNCLVVERFAPHLVNGFTERFSIAVKHKIRDPKPVIKKIKMTTVPGPLFTPLTKPELPLPTQLLEPAPKRLEVANRFKKPSKTSIMVNAARMFDETVLTAPYFKTVNGREHYNHDRRQLDLVLSNMGVGDTFVLMYLNGTSAEITSTRGAVHSRALRIYGEPKVFSTMADDVFSLKITKVKDVQPK